MSKLLGVFVAAATILVLSLSQGYAQAVRTWVSGVGDDANPCSRTAPCKTFAGAISKTAAGGEISVLDPGGFGAVTITKSISIVAQGGEGGLLACGTNGVVVNAAASDVISLSGLIIEGCGNGINGVRILQAGVVTIRKSVIRGFTGIAVPVEKNANPTNVFVSNTTIIKNGMGINVIRSAAAGVGNVFLNHAEVDANSGFGVRASGLRAFVWISSSQVRGNKVGLKAAYGGTINSYGNNVVAGNASDGAPTNTLPLQ